MEAKQIDYAVEINKVAEWMKDYVKKAGTKGYVIGLSSGIDSSVVASLAVKAVGAENVIGIFMPCQSSNGIKKQVEELSSNLGITLITVPVETPYEYLANRVVNPTQLTKANIKARLRMITLYAYANQYNCLVSGTSNLSEIMVGYFTKFGDGGVDIEPVGNYYKTEIYKFAELMPEIPTIIKTKAPSADLWDGQTDEKELGMKYVELDDILSNMENEKITQFEENKVYKVKEMMRKAEHKNNVPPRYERI